MRGMGQLDAPFFKIFSKSQIHGLVHERIIVHAERMVNAYINIVPGRTHADTQRFQFVGTVPVGATRGAARALKFRNNPPVRPALEGSVLFQPCPRFGNGRTVEVANLSRRERLAEHAHAFLPLFVAHQGQAFDV